MTTTCARNADPPRTLAWLALVCALPLAITQSAEAAIRFESPVFGQAAGTSGILWPPAPALGDLNGDGAPDAIVNAGQPGIHVLPGDGHGSFGAPVQVSAFGNGSQFFAIADFDGDGHTDFGAVALSEAAVYFGDGSGVQWTRAPVAIDLGLGAMSGDFDGDGQTDFAVITETPAPEYRPHVRAFLSRPSRTFEVVSTALDSLDTWVYSIRVADFDGDGRDDFVASGPTAPGEFLIALSNGDGTFTPRTVQYVPPLNTVRSLDVGDVNQDGHLDVAVAHRFGIAIHPGLGNGTFGTPQALIIMFSNVLGVALRDVTGDSLADLTWTDFDQLSISVRPGLGGGALGPAVASVLGKGLMPFLLSDLDGDERADALGMDAGTTSEPSGHPGLLVAHGNGQGGFGRPTLQLSLPPASYGPVAGDFDGDGAPDIAVLLQGAPTASVALVRHQPGRTLTLEGTRSTPGTFERVFTGDLDEDGRTDLVLGGNSLVWLRGSAESLLTSPALLPGGGLGLLGVADATGDGHLDLLGAGSSLLVIHPGNGDGTFGAVIQVPLSLTPQRAEVGDLAGDSHPDIALIAPGFGEFWAPVVLKGLGAGQFTAQPIPSFFGDRPRVPALGDIDGDGRGDLLTSGDQAQAGGFFDGRSILHLQQQDGTLAPPVTRVGLSSYGGPKLLRDVNGDGRADLFSVMGSSLIVGIGRGDGNFDVEAVYDGSYEPFTGLAWTPQLADFDLDGHQDLLVNSRQGSSTGVTIYYGRDPAPPTVSVLPPGWPTPLFIGTPTRIEWACGDDAELGDAEVFVSRHGSRGPFERVGTLPASQSGFDWTVTGPVSDSVCFKVLVRDQAGNTSWDIGATLRSLLPATSVGDGSGAGAPGLRLAVRGAVPVRSWLRMSLDLPQGGHATLSLHDLQGRRVATLIDAELPAGETRVDRPLSQLGSELRAGLYFGRLQCDGKQTTARVVVTD